jgi:hypothetical protein
MFQPHSHCSSLIHIVPASFTFPYGTFSHITLVLRTSTFVPTYIEKVGVSVAGTIVTPGKFALLAVASFYSGDANEEYKN